MKVVLLLIVLGLGLSQPAEAQSASIQIRITTELGAFVVTLDSAHAPITCANFLRYVDGGHYNGGSFFRTVTMDNQSGNPVKIEVIQAGIHPWRENDAFPAIPLERTSETGLRHVNGTISMARGEPNSATWSFFICIGDQPDLDAGGKRNPDNQGFAAFGVVTSGMDVVRRIHKAPSDGQALMPPVQILNVERLP